MTKNEMQKNGKKNFRSSCNWSNEREKKNKVNLINFSHWIVLFRDNIVAVCIGTKFHSKHKYESDNEKEKKKEENLLPNDA